VGSIILLALAAAVYPQLLAVVVIILTRPNPQPLLWGCYLASLLVVPPARMVARPPLTGTVRPQAQQDVIRDGAA
jgi:hypothetical protein